jgi:quercetin dioxygenase-like cupin family protein
VTGPETVDAGALPGGGDGVQWTLEAASDLNANVVDLAPGHAIDEHVNDEVDVVVVVLSGEGSATVDGEAHPLAAHVVAHLPKGSRRRIDAAATGLRYVTVHRRRGPLSIGSRPS